LWFGGYAVVANGVQNTAFGLIYTGGFEMKKERTDRARGVRAIMAL